jgi:hypothetical protein
MVLYQAKIREMAKTRKFSRIVSASPNRITGRGRRLRSISWEEVGRPWPPGGESLLDSPRQNEQLRLALVERLLVGEDERREASPYPKLSKRDFERTKLVVATVAPHLLSEIEFLMTVNYRPRNTKGRPHDPMTERFALVFELLRCCHVRRPARTIQSILEKMGKYVTKESIERNYRRRNKGRLVRVAGGFVTQVPAGDIHRVLLWRLHSLLSVSQVTAASSIGALSSLT